MNKTYCKLKENSKIYELRKVNKNIAHISCGNLNVTTDVKNIQILTEDAINKRQSTTSINIKSLDVPQEIMLRHMQKEEALSYLDKYIDQALVAKLGRVRIIHGRHGGILRNAVHEYLKNHPYVKEFHLADYPEGGIGATVAIIGKKKD